MFVTGRRKASSRGPRWVAVWFLIVVIAGCAASTDQEEARGTDGSIGGRVESVDGRRREPASIDVPQLPVVEDAEADEIRTAVERAVAFVEPQLDDVPQLELAFFDWMRRNWRLEGLNRAGDLIETQPRQDDAGRAVLERLVDPLVTLPDRASFDAAPGAFFEYDVMAVALHCDHRELSAEDIDVAEAAVSQGSEYEWAHTAYALRWMDELGCASPGGGALRDLVLVTLVDALQGATVADDASLSMSAALAVLGRPDLVPAGFRRIVVDQQDEGGGWAPVVGEPPGWHATGLALWTLSSMIDAGGGAPMIAFG